MLCIGCLLRSLGGSKGSRKEGNSNKQEVFCTTLYTNNLSQINPAFVQEAQFVVILVKKLLKLIVQISEEPCSQTKAEVVAM